LDRLRVRLNSILHIKIIVKFYITVSRFRSRVFSRAIRSIHRPTSSLRAPSNFRRLSTAAGDIRNGKGNGRDVWLNELYRVRTRTSRQKDKMPTRQSHREIHPPIRYNHDFFLERRRRSFNSLPHHLPVALCIEGKTVDIETLPCTKTNASKKLNDWTTFLVTTVRFTHHTHIITCMIRLGLLWFLFWLFFIVAGA